MPFLKEKHHDQGPLYVWRLASADIRGSPIKEIGRGGKRAAKKPLPTRGAGRALRPTCNEAAPSPARSQERVKRTTPGEHRGASSQARGSSGRLFRTF